MVRMNSLADALKTLYNAEKKHKRQVLLRPCSKVTVKFLTVMMKHGYIGEFEIIDDHRAGKIVVNLNGRLNKVSTTNTTPYTVMITRRTLLLTVNIECLVVRSDQPQIWCDHQLDRDLDQELAAIASIWVRMQQQQQQQQQQKWSNVFPNRCQCVETHMLIIYYYH